MKKIILCLFGLTRFLLAFANHIVGGEMVYQYLGPGVIPGTKSYQITLRLFRDNHCSNCAFLPQEAFIGLFDNDKNQQFGGYVVAAKTKGYLLSITSVAACIIRPPNESDSATEYRIKVDLPDNQNGYTAAYQTCCRVTPLSNVDNPKSQPTQDDPVGGGTVGATYVCTIPGLMQLPVGFNNSPQFQTGISIICANKKFSLDFSATDIDKDSLVYFFSDAYDGGPAKSSANINPSPPIASPPDTYRSVVYLGNYSASAPLGSKAIINPKTGIITGIAPPTGEYVVCVFVKEYRKGNLIGYHRKDFIVNVTDCEFAGAQLNPSYLTCNGFDYTFQNQISSSIIKTYNWEFSDKGTLLGNSTNPTPKFVFPDTGVFQVKLVINKGLDCTDSAFSSIGVYPGFIPGFTYSLCKNNPTQFTDTTFSKYGKVNSWSWNFGNLNAGSDTSTLQNPSYTYPGAGIKTITLIVGNEKGCIDTLVKDITILDKPFAGRDTAVVVKQLLQFNATGGANYSWSPSTNLSNPNIGNPTAIYDGSFDKITYRVIVSSPPNCLDSAYVTVRIFKTNPQVFVPTAFTPNGDNKNDLFRPFSVGISKLEFFRVFDRWGQLVFSTTINGQGWDGTIGGKAQSSGVYVWLVKGVDYTGKLVFEKGTVTLIR
ncbi:MAG: hypothetical protein NVS1B13_04830 [Flavisolibacter sp.]